MGSPAVSVCIPVFNCRTYIATAIDTVLAQTFTDFELIVLDNCSDDGTSEVIGSYHDPRLRVIRHATNIGAAGNWNRALAESSGSYVKLVCADDSLYPDCLARQVATLERADRNVVMTCCSRDIIDESGKKIFSRGYGRGSGLISGREAIRQVVRSGTNILGEVSAVLFRRDVIRQAGQFDQSLPYVIDVDLWVRILRHGALVVTPEALCTYRVSRSSWSVAVAASQSDNFCQLIARIADEYQVPLSRADRWRGQLMAKLNSKLRRFFYLVFLRGPTTTP